MLSGDVTCGSFARGKSSVLSESRRIFGYKETYRARLYAAHTSVIIYSICMNMNCPDCAQHNIITDNGNAHRYAQDTVQLTRVIRNKHASRTPVSCTCGHPFYKMDRFCLKTFKQIRYPSIISSIHHSPYKYIISHFKN